MEKLDKDFNVALEKHLRREELLYRAKHCPMGSRVDWLEPSCGSQEDLVDMLRWLGFRIKDIDACPDEPVMVTTTSGVIVFVNDCGFVYGRGY